MHRGVCVRESVCVCVCESACESACVCMSPLGDGLCGNADLCKDFVTVKQSPVGCVPKHLCSCSVCLPPPIGVYLRVPPGHLCVCVCAYCITQVSRRQGRSGGGGAACSSGVSNQPWYVPGDVPVMMPPVMPPAPPHSSAQPMLVNGRLLASCLLMPPVSSSVSLPKRRGPDLQTRKRRVCRRCIYFGEDSDTAAQCKLITKGKYLRECSHACPNCNLKTSCPHTATLSKK